MTETTQEATEAPAERAGKIKLPTGQQWIDALHAVGVDTDALLEKFEAELNTYIQKLPPEGDPERDRILAELDPVTRALVEAGEPIHVRLDSLAQMVDSSITTVQWTQLVTLAANELVELFKTKRSKTRKKALSMA